MGLTIHYNLTTDLKRPKDVRQLVEAIRQLAIDLPFESVSEIIEFCGDDPCPADDMGRWLRIHSYAHVQFNDCDYRVPAECGLAVSVFPGEGCETANFAFCKFPADLRIEGQQVATKLRGWSWQSFCKTQYASNPRFGGVQHFLRCHLGVIKILDFINATKLAKAEVHDESGYWAQRDIKALVRQVGEWNEFVAGFTSELRGLVGPGLESAITSFPNFEHLEAKGLERLAKLRRGNESQP